MCGGSGGSGRKSGGGGGSTNGDAGQPGEVYRAAQQPKVKRVLVVNGKLAPRNESI